MNEAKTTTDIRLRQALLTLALWLFATVGIGMLVRPDRPSTIAELITLLSQGVAWNLLLSLALLAVATRYFGWTDLGFRAPPVWRALRFLWLPILLLLPIFGLAFAIGLPPVRAVGFLALNTLLIALSEEWMFRGILFRALAIRRRIWPALLITSVVFGSVHVLNGFTYSNLTQSSVQAVAAMMTGLLLGALLVRTGSIWPSVVLHMVWNFGLLLVTVEVADNLQPLQPPTLQSLLVAVMIVMPNLFYALFLLRKVRGQPSLARSESV
ncbi:MAG: lysostaphin resistance A-like protein [Tabrizicola sp.]